MEQQVSENNISAGQTSIKKQASMDYKLLIDTAALAGTLMLENGAEIYRVEETIDYMCTITDAITDITTEAVRSFISELSPIFLPA